jgi:UDP-N-acetylmuramoyl-L-alanyl-D-glutamate--2,6-diaminopimelate ligase
MQRLLAEARSMGARYSVIETSSHALHQARVENVQFDVGVFTNLTRDHLDYHETMERYFEAKRHLFELLARGAKTTRAAVINGDDEYGQRLLQELPGLGLNDWSFGSCAGVSLRMVSMDESADGLTLGIEDSHAHTLVRIFIPCIGRHNAENALSAYGACRALGYEPEVLRVAMARIPQVPGRLERVGDQVPRVFVDYAHTPDALMRVLQAVRPTTRGDLWVVFGCGGDRDRGKRPQMAAVASDYADQVVITSDNPRTEAPQAIINDILVGASSPRVVELDRRKAILQTLAHARLEDTVVIAGKGHEDYQIIGTEKIPFSDQEVAREALMKSHTRVGNERL